MKTFTSINIDNIIFVIYLYVINCTLDKLNYTSDEMVFDESWELLPARNFCDSSHATNMQML